MNCLGTFGIYLASIPWRYSEPLVLPKVQVPFYRPIGRVSSNQYHIKTLEYKSQFSTRIGILFLSYMLSIFLSIGLEFDHAKLLIRIELANEVMRNASISSGLI